MNRFMALLQGKSEASFWSYHPRGNARCEPSLDMRLKKALEMSNSCSLCFRQCGVNRNREEEGFCRITTGGNVILDAVLLGEENFINPTYEIFLAGCNLRCGFCYERNYLRKPGMARQVSATEMASKIHGTVPDRAANLHWVGGEPTMHLVWILKVLLAMKKPVPMIWNSNMAMSSDALDLLENLPDLILADLHFWNPVCAESMGVPKGAIDASKTAIIRLSRSCSMIFRYLYLPGHDECCMKPMLHWIQQNAPHVCVHIMHQYVPPSRVFREAGENEVLCAPTRRPYIKEIRAGRQYAEGLGLSVWDEELALSDVPLTEKGFETAIEILPDGTVVIQNLAGDFSDLVKFLRMSQNKETPSW